MTLPSDPELLANFYLYTGSAQTLLAIYDMLAEIQMFGLEGIYPQDTVEFKVAADTIEALKATIAQKQIKIVHKAQELLD